MRHHSRLLAAAMAASFLWLAPAWASGATYTWVTGSYSGATATLLYGLNDSGQAVGYYVASDGTSHGLLVSNGSPSVLQYPGSVNTQLFAINNSGTIGGSWGSGSGTLGLIYQSGQFTSMSARVRAIANNGIMLIGSQLFNGSTYTQLPNYPGAVSTSYRAINNSGSAVGFYMDSSNTQHPFLYSGGNFTTPVCTSAQGGSFALNDQGTAVIMDNATSINYLYSGGVCTPLPFPSGANFMQVLALNNAGAFAGFYYLQNDPNTQYAFIATPTSSAVPVSSAWGLAVLATLMAATALLLLAGSRRRTPSLPDRTC